MSDAACLLVMTSSSRRRHADPDGEQLSRCLLLYTHPNERVTGVRNGTRIAVHVTRGTRPEPYETSTASLSNLRYVRHTPLLPAVSNISVLRYIRY